MLGLTRSRSDLLLPNRLRLGRPSEKTLDDFSGEFFKLRGLGCGIRIDIMDGIIPVQKRNVGQGRNLVVQHPRGMHLLNARAAIDVRFYVCQLWVKRKDFFGRYIDGLSKHASRSFVIALGSAGASFAKYLFNPSAEVQGYFITVIIIYFEWISICSIPAIVLRKTQRIIIWLSRKYSEYYGAPTGLATKHALAFFVPDALTNHLRDDSASRAFPNNKLPHLRLRPLRCSWNQSNSSQGILPTWQGAATSSNSKFQSSTALFGRKPTSAVRQFANLTQEAAV